MIPLSTLRQVGGALDWLVYGMTWEHVGGARPAQRSLQRAKACKATHFIAAHEGFSAVGLARMEPLAIKTKTKSRRRYSSAGMLFASRRLKGVYCGQMDLLEDGIWFIASHDGVVIPGFDLVLHDADQVSEAIARLGERYSDVQQVDVTQPTLEELKSQSQARLSVVKTSAQQIPTWMKVSAVVLIAYGLYTEGQGWWDEYQAEQDLAQNPTQQFDFNVERAKQLDAWQSTIRLDSPQGLEDVLQMIGSLPMGFGGWTLATGLMMANGVSAAAIECVPTASGWSCTALYSRTAAGTNASFKISAPKQCTVGWVDLEKAQINCAFSATRQTLDRQRIERPETINLDYIPKVQSVLLAYREVKIDPWTRVTLANPTVVNQRGDRVTLTPSGSETPKSHVPGKQGFSFIGPLGSWTVLPLTGASVIKKIVIRRVDVSDPTVSTSALSAELKGEMYVQ
jgi:hypothetical protein